MGALNLLVSCYCVHGIHLLTWADSCATSIFFCLFDLIYVYSTFYQLCNVLKQITCTHPPSHLTVWCLLFWVNDLCGWRIAFLLNARRVAGGSDFSNSCNFTRSDSKDDSIRQIAARITIEILNYGDWFHLEMVIHLILITSNYPSIWIHLTLTTLPKNLTLRPWKSMVGRDEISWLVNLPPPLTYPPQK